MNFDRLSAAVELVRRCLPVREEWVIQNRVGAGLPVANAGDSCPDGFVRAARIVDGGNFGVVTVFALGAVGDFQFYADQVEGSPVRLGREEWFCCGLINDEPFFIKKADGSVWMFPDVGVEWWMSPEFHQSTDSLTSFLSEFVFGPRYREITPLGEGDQWLQLLNEAGLA
ncbi:hypothetical protein ACL02U_30445 [Streptomyces sp. MS06]|uniref:hypothetical protein n=1 Tax=Streptomyces sp. MS06 TaxID=3385974 RepID=UPI0039A3159E